MRWLSKATVLWALWEAPDLPSHLLSTLIAVAAHTGDDGQGAYISAATVGQLTRKTEGQAKRNLRELEKLGLISRGNQRLVAHIRADRRPVVYDVPMPERGSAGATSSRGSTHATPQAHGVAPRPSRGSAEGPNGVAPVLPKEFLKNSRTARGRASAENARADAPIKAPPPARRCAMCRSGDHEHCDEITVGGVGGCQCPCIGGCCEPCSAGDHGRCEGLAYGVPCGEPCQCPEHGGYEAVDALNRKHAETCPACEPTS